MGADVWSGNHGINPIFLRSAFQPLEYNGIRIVRTAEVIP